MKINNLPANFTDYPYIVARLYEGEFWFWGAYRDHNCANEAALEEDGVVFEVSIWEGRDF